MATIASTPVPAHQLVAESGQLPKLRTNQGAYVDPQSIGWMKPTPRDAPLEEMRRRYDEDGYVWVKELIPREDVLDMRQHYFEHMSPTGILQADTSPRDGIFNKELDPLSHNGVGPEDLPPEQQQVDLLIAAHVIPAYQKFVEHPDLRQFIRTFMNWQKEVMVLRTLLRHNVPYGVPAGVHYDRLFLRGGEAEFLTGWIPIGDCSAEGGGLMYLENSTELGKKMEADFMKRAESFTPEQRISAFNANMMSSGQLTQDGEHFGRVVAEGKLRWLAADFEAGDVVFHNPYMIHAALQNEDPKGRIRLSTDLRFYEEGAPLDKRWMRVWTPNDGL
ncbi:MAG: hypothetical protein M1821_006430 [Bathelium mastoideum]|nr:MAG: hypothetical protein M1821_006430 [Bathelium mastoideum]